MKKATTDLLADIGETPLLLPRLHQPLLHSQPLEATRLLLGALPTLMPLAVAPVPLCLEVSLPLARPHSRPSPHRQPVGC